MLGLRPGAADLEFTSSGLLDHSVQPGVVSALPREASVIRQNHHHANDFRVSFCSPSRLLCFLAPAICHVGLGLPTHVGSWHARQQFPSRPGEIICHTVVHFKKTAASETKHFKHGESKPTVHWASQTGLPFRAQHLGSHTVARWYGMIPRFVSMGSQHEQAVLGTIRRWALIAQ